MARLLLLVLLAGGAAATDLPEGFLEEKVVSGITGATAKAVSPGGRVFICEQKGALRVVKDDELLPDPFVAMTLDSYWERGLIGVALHPDFPEKPHVYVTYVSPNPYPHHVVSRSSTAISIGRPS